MKKLIYLFIICFIAIDATYSKDLITAKSTDSNDLCCIEISNPDAKFIRVTDAAIDTISVNDLLPEKGELSLICFSENWCKPSYREFNTLYNDGVIDFLKNNKTRLIILAYDYPFINVNQLDTLARDNIESDFEIYYSANRNDRHIESFPQIWLVDSHKCIIFHSQGVLKDYNNLKENIKQYNSNHICPRCNGTGKVEPSRYRYGDPDTSVGICRMCGGKGSL